MSVSLVSLVAACLGITWLGLCDGYGKGAPNSDHVCGEMFPEGHYYDAQLDTPPFQIFLSSNVYSRPMEKITVTVNATDGYFFKGLFVQARRANCSHPLRKVGLGYFRLMPGEEYLQTVTCYGHDDSAVTHRYNTTVVSTTFEWFTPGTMEGHVYFVATIVKNMDTFWTNVTSDVLRQSDLEAPYEPCQMKMYIDYPNKNPAPKPTPAPPSSTQPTQTTSPETDRKQGGAVSVVVNVWSLSIAAVTSMSLARLL